MSESNIIWHLFFLPFSVVAYNLRLPGVTLNHWSRLTHHGYAYHKKIHRPLDGRESRLYNILNSIFDQFLNYYFQNFRTYRPFILPAGFVHFWSGAPNSELVLPDCSFCSSTARRTRSPDSNPSKIFSIY